ncbi:MAG: type II secretion system F family protein [Aigarchaeota archaeon]|nr:type II secretion system F family protein [Aigarchaeota archaeon]MDW8092697.1 type II secretion system F family protein [Nitrososphaerota archaeon]
MGSASILTKLSRRYEWLTPLILSISPRLPERLKSIGVRIYPEAYIGMLGFWLLVSMITSVIISVLLLIAQIGLLVALIAMCIPFIIFVLLLTYPSIIASNIKSKLESEFPYASFYMAVMISGGTHPFTSLSRLDRIGLTPTIGKVSRMIDISTKAWWLDPISSTEHIATILPQRDLSELLKGYASTVRSGGDVVSYFKRRAELIFDLFELKINALIERFSIYMEAYLAASVLLALGFYMMFMVSRTLRVGAEFLSIEAFFSFSYLLLPLISVIFLYLADISQIKYPYYDMRPYRVLLISIIPSSIVLIALLAPYISPELSLIFSPVNVFKYILIDYFGISRGFDLAISIAVSLIVLFIPPAIVEIKISRYESSVFKGAVQFMREVVEIRKTGLNPEKAIIELSGKNYGRFNKILKIIANKLAWGASLLSIYNYLEGRIRSWLTKISLFTFFDSIEVGGGTPETLDIMSSFNERLLAIEQKRRSSMRPLVIIPYIGAILLAFTSIALLGYMKESLLLAGRTLEFDQFLRTFLPPIVINAAMMGLVAGKLSEESVAAGFKHSVLILFIMILTFLLSPYVMSIFTVIGAT